MQLEETKEVTVSAAIVLPTVANEPRKPIASRLDSKSWGSHRSGRGGVRFHDPSNDLNPSTLLRADSAKR